MDCVVGSGGAGPRGAPGAGLAHPRRDSLIARLRRLAARLIAIARTPIPPPLPDLPPLEPGFLPTLRLRLASDIPPPPDPPHLPGNWSWLARLLPPTVTGRAQLEELLRTPAIQDMLAADRRLGPVLRALGWMLGVERGLLPTTRRRRRKVIVVPGTSTEAATAAAIYAADRDRGISMADVIARYCASSPDRRDRRPVWYGRDPPVENKAWGAA